MASYFKFSRKIEIGIEIFGCYFNLSVQIEINHTNKDDF